MNSSRIDVNCNGLAFVCVVIYVSDRILKPTTNTLLPRVAQSMGNRFYRSDGVM
jgi:hypothetical protein